MFSGGHHRTDVRVEALWIRVPSYARPSILRPLHCLSGAAWRKSARSATAASAAPNPPLCTSPSPCCRPPGAWPTGRSVSSLRIDRNCLRRGTASQLGVGTPDGLLYFLQIRPKGHSIGYTRISIWPLASRGIRGQTVQRIHSSSWPTVGKLRSRPHRAPFTGSVRARLVRPLSADSVPTTASYDTIRANTRESASFAKMVTKSNGVAGELDAFFLAIHHSQSEWIGFRKAFLGLSW